MSPGELSEILSGKRPLSAKASRKVSAHIGLNSTETQLPPRQVLDADFFEVVSDWYCFAILNLFDTVDFRPTPGWIAKRLGISQSEAKTALERLERVGLLKRNAKRELKRDDSFVMSPSGIPSKAIRNHHREILTKAMQALETQPISERDITGLGFAVDPIDLPEITNEIRQFRDRIVAKYSRGKRTEVYCLETALFRLTQNEEKES